MAHFFIHRPIFAWVIALVIMLAGILTITKMPIAQYPTIAPPTVSISATYPGASAATVENTVTQIIEQQMNGLDGLRYISSNSAGNGQASITLNFDQGVDPDRDWHQNHKRSGKQRARGPQQAGGRAQKAANHANA